MIRHGDIWRALDRLAASRGWSPSGLARRAGLDPTAFNPSKRLGRDGRPRWPSSESVAGALKAAGGGIHEFADLVEGRLASRRRVPILGYAQAGSKGYFDAAGYPAGIGWNEAEFPAVADPNAFGLVISGDSMRPVFRPGDVILVSPAAPIARGDRVVLKTRKGEVMAKEIGRQSATRIDLISFNPDFPPQTLAPRQVLWMHRVVWASQ
jgi:phage repressor protein C with HTH and peptisase S24 domain